MGFEHDGVAHILVTWYLILGTSRRTVALVSKLVIPILDFESGVLVGGDEAGELLFCFRVDGIVGQVDPLVGVGVVIRGETYHFEIVAGESARGIMALTMDGMAIGNGILTVENEAQALVRADPAQNDKGGEAAKAAMALLDLQGRFAG